MCGTHFANRTREVMLHGGTGRGSLAAPVGVLAHDVEVRKVSRRRRRLQPAAV